MLNIFIFIQFKIFFSLNNLNEQNTFYLYLNIFIHLNYRRNNEKLKRKRRKKIDEEIGI